MNRYEVGKQVGEGSFGFVYLATNKKTMEKRAIKKLKGNVSWDTMVAMRELQSLFKISLHDNIVRLYEVHHLCSSVYYVFEYMESGSLDDVTAFRINNKLGPFPQKDIISITYQALRGLAHIHKSGYMHRDMKPENLLMSGSVCKVADFSLTRTRPTESELTMYVSTRWYRAPEVLLSDPKYFTPIDMFALGCIVAEMHTLLPLFPGSTEVDQLHRVLRFTGSPHQVEWEYGKQLMETMGIHVIGVGNSDPRRALKKAVPGATKAALDFMLELLHLDPKKRMTSEEALKHSYLSSYEDPLSFNIPSCVTVDTVDRTATTERSSVSALTHDDSQPNIISPGGKTRKRSLEEVALPASIFRNPYASKKTKD